MHLTMSHPQVMAVNVNGVLYTAQAAGQQMDRFGNGGSIIMIASISGHGSNQVRSGHRCSRLQPSYETHAGTPVGIVQHIQVRRTAVGA